MEPVIFIIGVQIGALIISLAAIIYLVVRRIRKRKSEQFEKRDN